LVKTWKAADELPGLVALSLSKTIKTYPATGWIRADQASNVQLLNELNELRKKKEELEEELFELRRAQKIDIPNLASLDEKITTFGNYSTYDHFSRNWKNPNWRLETTWGDLFALISPYLLDHPNDTRVKGKLAEVLFEKTDNGSHSAQLDDQVYQTIKIQLQALGLVEVQYLKTTGGGMALFWSLTQPGYALMMSLRTVKSTSPNAT
jgi:hypothetical protein